MRYYISDATPPRPSRSHSVPHWFWCSRGCPLPRTRQPRMGEGPAGPWFLSCPVSLQRSRQVRSARGLSHCPQAQLYVLLFPTGTFPGFQTRGPTFVFCTGPTSWVACLAHDPCKKGRLRHRSCPMEGTRRLEREDSVTSSYLADRGVCVCRCVSSLRSVPATGP